jgi:hypothetical protein
MLEPGPFLVMGNCEPMDQNIHKKTPRPSSVSGHRYVCDTPYSLHVAPRHWHVNGE